MAQITIHEKYREERSKECALVCNITRSSVTAVYYDIALERRVGRSICYNAQVTPETVMYHLRCIIFASMEQYKISAADIKTLVLAAPPVATMLLEECAQPTEFFLQEDTELLIMPIVSATLGGGFAAALASVELEDGVAVAEISDSIAIARLDEGKLQCVSMPLSGGFSGESITDGMICERGAIDDVWREHDGTICYSVEGDIDSCGIAPSAAVAALRIMLKQGIVDSDGIMTDRDNFALGEEFFISQSDVRLLQSDRAMTAAVLSIFEGSKVYFSGEVFCVNGMKSLSEIGAISLEMAETAGFCRSAAEQGMINCAVDRSLYERICSLSAACEDATDMFTEQIDDLYIKKLTF